MIFRSMPAVSWLLVHTCCVPVGSLSFPFRNPLELCYISGLLFLSISLASIGRRSVLRSRGGHSLDHHLITVYLASSFPAINTTSAFEGALFHCHQCPEASLAMTSSRLELQPQFSFGAWLASCTPCYQTPKWSPLRSNSSWVPFACFKHSVNGVSLTVLC